MFIAFCKFFNIVNTSQLSLHPIFFLEVHFLLDLEPSRPDCKSGGGKPDRETDRTLEGFTKTFATCSASAFVTVTLSWARYTAVFDAFLSAPNL